MDQESTAAPAEGQDTPTDESAPQVEETREQTPPNEDTASQDQQETVDWEKRYNDLRPEYDRGQQALKEAQQYQQVVQALQSDDPQERAWAADILGLEFEDGDTPDDEEEEEFRDPRVDQLLAQQQEQAYEQEIQALDSHISSTIDQLAEKHKLDLSDEEKDLIYAQTLALEPAEGNQPNVSRAFEMYTGILDKHIKRYREGKKNAPSPPVPGQSGANAAQPETRKERQALAMQLAQRASMRD